jgi:AcrR family transcriptional regulator
MRTRILDEAVRIIAVQGERSLRLRDLARGIGISEPTLYHYFENRDSLVVAALAHRYRIELSETIDPFVPAVRKCTTQAEFMSVFHKVYRDSIAPGRMAVRMTRAEVVASAFTRESLRVEIKEIMMESLGPSIEALQIAKDRGWLRPDIDIHAFAFLNLSLISSRIFPEIQGDPDLLAQWDDLAFSAVKSLIT